MCALLDSPLKPLYSTFLAIDFDAKFACTKGTVLSAAGYRSNIVCAASPIEQHVGVWLDQVIALWLQLSLLEPWFCMYEESEPRFDL